MLRIQTVSGEELVALDLASFLETQPAGMHPVRALKQHLHSISGMTRFRQRLVCLDGKVVLEDDGTLRPGEVQVVLLRFCPTSGAHKKALRDAAGRGMSAEVETLLERPQDPDLGEPTPLFEASKHGQTEVARLLLEANADKDTANFTHAGATPLFIAAQEGHLEVLRLLLEANANVDKATHAGATPLYIAAQKGQLEVSRLLLEANVDKDKAAQDGATALFIAAQKGQLEVARLLLEANANMDKAKRDFVSPLRTRGTRQEGATPLYTAAEYGQLELVRLLLEAKADMDKATHAGATPLYIAAQKGQLEVSRLLLEANANMDKATQDGTPLFHAANEGQLEVARLLLEAKADMDKATQHGVTPLYIAAQKGQLEFARLLLESNVDKDKAAQDGATPLCIAAQKGQLEIALLLLEASANMDKAMQDGVTPLYTAAAYGKLEVVRRLLEAKADMDKAMQDGATPLYIAAQKGRLEVARLLLEANADMDKATQDGVTPLYIAAQKGQLEAPKSAMPFQVFRHKPSFALAPNTRDRFAMAEAETVYRYEPDTSHVPAVSWRCLPTVAILQIGVVGVCWLIQVKPGLFGPTPRLVPVACRVRVGPVFAPELAKHNAASATSTGHEFLLQQYRFNLSCNFATVPEMQAGSWKQVDIDKAEAVYRYESGNIAHAPKKDYGPLDFTGKLAGGLRLDIRRRAPLYCSDWTDAFKPENFQKSVSSILFIAALAPAITFGSRFLDGTNGQFGVMEMIMSTCISGLIFSTFSGQPLSILGATGPFLAYTLVVYDLAVAVDVEFMPFYFWTCMWCSLFTVLVAVFDLCALMKHVTMFSEDIFAGLISLIFIIDGARPIIENFTESRLTLTNCMFEALLFIWTFGLATYLSSFRRNPWTFRFVRNFAANFAVTIALVSGSALAAIYSNDTGLRMLQVDADFSPNLSLSDGSKRPWIINPAGMDRPFPAWGIAYAILPAIGFAVLGYLDQFVRGALTLPVCAVLGLPLSVASTVPSITHVISLTTYEVKQLPEGERKVPTKVVEQRATNFLIHVLIGSALFLAPVLKFLPRAVLQGVFFYMGIASLTGNNLFDRLKLWLIWDPAKYPQYHYVQKLPISRVHLYTVVQETSVVFPFFMASLAIIRKAMRFMFTEDELKQLDGLPGEDEEEDASMSKPDIVNLDVKEAA
ncbi:Sodium-driven chloride bicarbonate exchanger [Symbiodinium microadriaticum]|uniref:Sodium-driven chloride bicarbonate exchanger n=1 Tax=Symbiodinium microadriaticum TaxID=2951 RepID=A0A1Q9ET46_SYMMI|nr:Sodium-driven chloride bicarbonate exchanger [Symbiodinium microadriaticum]